MAEALAEAQADGCKRCRTIDIFFYILSLLQPVIVPLITIIGREQSRVGKPV